MTWWGWLAFWMLIYLAQAVVIGFAFSRCKDLYAPYALVIYLLLTMVVAGIVHYNL